MSRNRAGAAFAVTVFVAVVLTCLAVVLIFVTGENGLLTQWESRPGPDPSTRQEKTDEEKLDELQKKLSGVRDTLSSPYMIATGKTVCVSDAAEESLVETEGVRLDENAAEALGRFIEAARREGHSVTVLAGFRTEEEQNDAFEKAVTSFTDAGYSRAEAERRASESEERAGYSEHQTGYAVDLAESASMTPAAMRESDLYAFAVAHIAEYGFVQSFRAESSALTGYAEMPCHFRYVGDPEAAQYIMSRHITLGAYRSYLNALSDSLTSQISLLEEK